MDGEASWWTTSGNIGLPPLARAMGVGRQQQDGYTSVYHKKYSSFLREQIIIIIKTNERYQSMILNQEQLDRRFPHYTERNDKHAHLLYQQVYITWMIKSYLYTVIKHDFYLHHCIRVVYRRRNRGQGGLQGGVSPPSSNIKILYYYGILTVIKHSFQPSAPPPTKESSLCLHIGKHNYIDI